MAEKIAAVLLAGGQSRRMGGTDKMLLEAGGKTLLERVLARITPQVSAMLLNVNGDPTRFAAYALPKRADVVAGHLGPLAGILTGLEWVRENHPDIAWLVSVATDTPSLPLDLVIRLQTAVSRENAEMGCARSDGNRHPVFGLWPVSQADQLRHALVKEDLRKVGFWLDRYKVAYADWPGGTIDPFVNVNTPEDLARFADSLAAGSD